MRWAANGRIDHRQHSAGWTGGVGGEALPRRGRRPRRGTRGGQVNRHGAERGGGHAIDPLRPSYEFCTFVRGRPAAQGVCWPHPSLSTTGAQGDDQTGAAAASGHLAGQPPREDPRLPPPADPASGSPRTGGSPRTRCAAGRPTAGGAAASMTRRDGDAAVAHCPPENRAKNTPQRAAMPLPAPPPRSLLPLRFPVSSCSPAPLAAPRAQAATTATTPPPRRRRPLPPPPPRRRAPPQASRRGGWPTGPAGRAAAARRGGTRVGRRQSSAPASAPPHLRRQPGHSYTATIRR